MNSISIIFITIALYLGSAFGEDKTIFISRPCPPVPDCSIEISEKSSKIASLEALISDLQAKVNSFPAVPNGSTGCDSKYSGGYCWRYCQGTSGKWCYTKQTCSAGNECAYIDKCPGINCGSNEPNCVKVC